MKKIFGIILILLGTVSCGLLDSGEGEIVNEAFLPFVKINEITFSEEFANVTATIQKGSPCWVYNNTNILLRDGKYYFAARGFERGEVCPAVIVEQLITFKVKLQPYNDIHFYFLNYNNQYLDTLVVAGD